MDLEERVGDHRMDEVHVCVVKAMAVSLLNVCRFQNNRIGNSF